MKSFYMFFASVIDGAVSSDEICYRAIYKNFVRTMNDRGRGSGAHLFYGVLAYK